jgi:tetratricopeptide (TPR) repeat protein
MFRLNKALLAVILLMLAAAPVRAANEGQGDLDKATDAKLSANTVGDLGEVIRLTENALAKGLDEANTAFADKLLAATLIQRAQETVRRMLAGRLSVADFSRQRESALADLEKAVKLDPKQPDAHMLIAQLHLVPGGDVKRAREAIDKALESGLAAPAVQIKALLVRAGLEEEMDKRLADINKALELDPDNVTALLMRAGVYREKGEQDKALADADRALQLGPEVPAAIRTRAMLLTEQRRFGEAVEELQKLQRLAPRDTLTLLQLAILFSADDKPEKAIAAYSAVLAEDPKEWRALRGRGDAYLNIGKQIEAIADYENGLMLQPDDQGMLNNLAWVLATSPRDSLRDGRRAIELATKAGEATEYKLPHILSTLAAAYAETGDFESAVKWSTKSVELSDKEQIEALKKELESFKAKKAWRELLVAKKALVNGEREPKERPGEEQK